MLIQIIIDGIAGQYYFRLIHSSGTYESPHHPITPAQIAQLSDVIVQEDYRDVYLGITIDNVMVTSTSPTAQLTISASAIKADSTVYTAGTWTNQTVTVHFTCAEYGSGLVTCPPDQVFSADGVTPTATGTATDSLSNTATATFGPIQIDKTPPVITASATNADTTVYTAGTWTTQIVTVHFTCSDSGSGVATCPASQIFSTGV